MRRTEGAGIKKFCFLGIMAGLFVCGCGPQKALTGKRIKAAEKGLMRAVYLKGLKPEKLALAERMAFYKVPGIGIAAIDKNKIEWVRAFGERDASVRQPVTGDTLFQGGAFSQMMTAAAVLALAEKGQIDLDANVATLLKTWQFPPIAPVLSNRQFSPPAPGVKSDITLRALLTHSAGLLSQTFAGYAIDELLPNLIQILDGEAPAKNSPAWMLAPRTSTSRTRYSEPGYAIVEQVLRDLTGKPFSVFIAETVFTPLAMKNSTFVVPLPEEPRSRAAAGHLRDGKPVPGLWHNYPESAAKGLWTTPADFAAFLSDLLQAAAGGEGKLLSPETARLMLSSQIEGHGFGFLVDGQGADLHYTLNGATRGYSCFMAVYPAKGQGVVIMTNSENGTLLIREILAALAEAYGWAGFRPEEKEVLRLDPGTYQAYSGRYEVNPAYALDVSRDDYALLIQPTGQTPAKFYAEGQTLFYSADPYIRIQFFKDKKGAVERLVLWQGDFEIEAKKIR
jgi:CubicO group peptidase (beta-lactamase class C family)